MKKKWWISVDSNWIYCKHGNTRCAAYFQFDEGCRWCVVENCTLKNGRTFQRDYLCLYKTWKCVSCFVNRPWQRRETDGESTICCCRPFFCLYLVLCLWAKTKINSLNRWQSMSKKKRKENMVFECNNQSLKMHLKDVRTKWMNEYVTMSITMCETWVNSLKSISNYRNTLRFGRSSGSILVVETAGKM